MKTPCLGEIRLFGSGAIPEGWALCDGQALQILQYSALHELLNGAFGHTETTFNLPDLRGRTPIGVSETYKIGNNGGEEAVALTNDTFMTHGHELFASSKKTCSMQVTGTVLGTVPSDKVGYLYSKIDPTKPPTRFLSASTVAWSGQGARHNNMQPSLVVNFCIALVGDYPTSGDQE